MSAGEPEINPKKRGLGRGLDALFEDDEGVYPQVQQEGHTPALNKRQSVGLDQLQPGMFQPRTVFDDGSLDELAASIKSHGLLQPIVARPIVEEAGRYEIIAGERRWRAAQKAGLHEVPAIIMPLSDSEALEIALIENLQREDLNPVDEAMAYKKLMDDYAHTQEKLAQVLGKSRSHIANMIRLLGLPDTVLGQLERGMLSAGHARALVTAENPAALAQEVIDKGLSVRETERLCAEKAGRRSESRSASGKQKDADTLALENQLSEGLGMRVSIDISSKEKGRLSVGFQNYDQLDLLIKKLS